MYRCHSIGSWQCIIRTRYEEVHSGIVNIIGQIHALKYWDISKYVLMMIDINRKYERGNIGSLSVDFDVAEVTLEWLDEFVIIS
jgi:hypothetical protein